MAQYKYVALVPLRGGSKGIPGKNIKPLNGRPLCFWVLDAAVGSSFIDKVYVSTDSNEIKVAIERSYPSIKIIDRPLNLGLDTTSTEDVVEHFNSQVQYENLVLLQATSPLTTCIDLDQAIEFFSINNFDSLLTGVLQKRFYWNLCGQSINYDSRNRPRRQNFEGCFVENGAFYITKRHIYEKHKNRLGGQIGIYEMSEDTLDELDEPADWPVVELKMKLRATG